MNSSRRKLLLAGVASVAPAYLLGTRSASAQSVPSSGAQTQGIGIVNIQDAIIQTNEGRKGFDDLRARFGPRQTTLKQENDQITTLQKALQAQSTNLSTAERSKRQKDIAAKRKKLEQDFAQAQKEFQDAEREIINRVGSKMVKILDSYAPAHGYVVVFDVSNPQTPILWANAGANITKPLVEAYNAVPAEAPKKP